MPLHITDRFILEILDPRGLNINLNSSIIKKNLVISVIDHLFFN